MTLHLLRLASLIFNQAHLITPQAAEAILHALDGRIGELRFPDDDLRASGTTDDLRASRFVGESVRGENGRWKGYSITKGGTAIVPIIGELVNRGAYLGADSGLVSYEGVRQQLRNAADDPRVRSIVLDIDSPGGMASGMSETAGLVRQISASKPVVAVANALTASAAYGIASGATRIVASESSQVGSIGVLYVHADRSAEMAKRGVKMTIIHAGAHKVDGHPYAPLPDAVRADIQALVDKVHAGFIATVLAGRPQLTEKQVRDTEARVYVGAEAVAVGLADEVGTFESAVADAESGKVQSGQQKQGVSSVPANSPEKVAATKGRSTMTQRQPGGATATTPIIQVPPLGEALAAIAGRAPRSGTLFTTASSRVPGCVTDRRKAPATAQAQSPTTLSAAMDKLIAQQPRRSAPSHDVDRKAQPLHSGSLAASMGKLLAKQGRKPPVAS